MADQPGTNPDDPTTPDAVKQHLAEVAALAVASSYLVTALTETLISKGLLAVDDRRQILAGVRAALEKNRTLGQMAVDTWSATLEFLDMTLDTEAARPKP